MRKEANEEGVVDTLSKLSPEQQSNSQRLPQVMEELSNLVFRETPTVAISSLVSVLSGVLLVVGADPMEEARNVGEAVQGCTLETCNGALSQPLAFELAQGGEDCELEPADGGAEVQTFLQRHERDAQRLEILEHRQECFRSRPIRSSAQHTTTLIFARRASSSSRSRPGRRSFAPLISSVYSA
jgi:hypothetical protein